MRDSLKAMREMRERAMAAFTQIDAQMRELHGVMGEWKREIDAQQASPRQTRPNSKPSKYVALAITLAAESDDGSASLEEIIGAAAKKWTDAAPHKGNIKRALDGTDLLKLDEDGRYRPISD